MIAAIGRLFSSLVVGILALCKRAMCFLNRKRRDSGSILPTHIQDVNHDIPTQVLSNNYELPAQIDPLPLDHNVPPSLSEPDDGASQEEEVFTEWDNWEKLPVAQPQIQTDKPRSTSSYISYARQAAPEPEPEPEPDYFSDLGLAPTIQKQKKVLVKPRPGAVQAPPPSQSSRLAFTPDMAAPLSAELEDWDDSTGAWEDEDLNLDTDQVMRQTRKQERERRLAEHQKRNQDREHRKLSKDNSLLGTKIS